MAATVLHQPSGTASELPLASFRVAGFRAFHDLQVPELGRVNLFVGRNNAGKSSLLDAIYLYAQGATRGSIRDLLLSREEIRLSAWDARPRDESVDLAISRLFHSAGARKASNLVLGPLNDPGRALSIRRGWVLTNKSEVGSTNEFFLQRPEDWLGEEQRALEVTVWQGKPRLVPDARVFRSPRTPDVPRSLHSAWFVPPDGLSHDDIGYAWDRIALTDDEYLVLDALRIIAPDVDRISLVGEADGAHERRVMARVRSEAGPVPLRSMGDGMNRLLGLTLALANARDGILLVDEIENGLHYSVQVDVWRTIFSAAASLNVQVFATTHSWDCIRAFAAATDDEHAPSAMLYRLDRRVEGEVRAVRYNAADVAVAADQDIEVR